MFLRCPKQWEYRYVKGLKIPPSGAMVLGSAYHEGLAARFEYVIEHGGEQPKVELALDHFDMAFERIRGEHLVNEEEENLEFDEVIWDEDPGYLKDIGIVLIERYHRQIAPLIKPLSVEERETILINHGIFRIPLVIITDLTTPKSIIDHKVKSRRFSEDDLRQDLQATAYSIAKKKPLEFHVALKTKQPAIEIQKTYRDGRETIFFTELVTKVWQAIGSGVFPPNPIGWHCSEKWCGYYPLCKGG